MDKDYVVAGLAEINAFCQMVIQAHPKESEDSIKRWEECTREAIKLLNAPQKERKKYDN